MEAILWLWFPIITKDSDPGLTKGLITTDSIMVLMEDSDPEVSTKGSILVLTKGSDPVSTAFRKKKKRMHFFPKDTTLFIFNKFYISRSISFIFLCI